MPNARIGPGAISGDRRRTQQVQVLVQVLACTLPRLELERGPGCGRPAFPCPVPVELPAGLSLRGGRHENNDPCALVCDDYGSHTNFPTTGVGPASDSRSNETMTRERPSRLARWQRLRLR